MFPVSLLQEIKGVEASALTNIPFVTLCIGGCY